MTTAKPSDPTFRSYTSDQARQYAEARSSYPPKLYDTVLGHHADTGGRFDVLVDVGCGPGHATRDLAAKFAHAVGLDAGEEMIQTARRLGGTTASGEPVLFEVCEAEKIADAEGVERGGVDLLISAMAVHWFSMPEFWDQAAQLVRPGGTVALWTCASIFCHPSTPNAAAVQQALDHLEKDILQPYKLPPNRPSRDMYDNLPLPWTVDPPVAAFPESGFVRHEWDRNGVLTDGADFFGGSREVSLQQLERALATANMVTRWREAHPELANTDEDCVVKTIRQIRQIIGPDAGDKIRVGGAVVILLFKRAE
ncbi:hypothetical protein VTN77DRAFT_8765 [Rasamsonia byssochlamydoides]|uniref:uncharacterized protein n=1 Tax=Rasamsonia byssochlamydoides TaxID=89139 RepID=UPI003744A316